MKTYWIWHDQSYRRRIELDLHLRMFAVRLGGIYTGVDLGCGRRGLFWHWWPQGE